MKWRIALAVVLLLPASTFALWWVWPVPPLPAVFALETCRLSLPVDRETGAVLTGIEDIAPAGDGRVFLSAYDRVATEAAMADGRVPPNGGIYRAEIGRLLEPEPAALENLVDPAASTGGFHPHGIHHVEDKLLVINRALAASDGPATRVTVFADTGAGLRLHRQIESPDLCAANDLTHDGGRIVVTLDRADCPGLSTRDALDTDGSGSLAAASPTEDRVEVLATGLAFPNGVLIARTGRGRELYIAETRARRLRAYPADAVAGPGAFIELPGGPDNLTPAPGGAIVAALHPHLLRLAAYKFGWAARAPSRVARIDPETRAVDILFDDPDGALLPGITAALLSGDGTTLIAGAARAPGLLVCKVTP